MLSWLHPQEPSSQAQPSTQSSGPSAIERAWRAGELSWLLRPWQTDVYEDVRAKLWGGDYCKLNAGSERRYILKCHRRYGKSFCAGVIATELCIQKPGARVYWAAETQKQVKRIILPNMRRILRTCPEELRPEWKASEGKWVFPNGSEIYVAGCEDEGKADRLRGDGADLFIIDEAGSIAPLRYVYRSIALWMVAECGGRVLMVSSPAKTPAHEFTMYAKLAEHGLSEAVKAEPAEIIAKTSTIQERVRELTTPKDVTRTEPEPIVESVSSSSYVGSGGYAKRDVYDSQWDERLLEELAAECGGKDTVEWQREALALDVVDEKRAIIFEYTGAATEIVGEWKRPRYFFPFVAMDLGWDPDFTFVVFGYYDFENDWDVIEDEIVMSRMTTDALAEAIKAKEAALWGDYFAQLDRERHLFDQVQLEPQRVSDIGKQIVADLGSLHDLPFGDAEKFDKEAGINLLRVRVKSHRSRIHRRCKNLQAHLAAGIWNAKRTSYERIEGFGHFDGVDAALYFTRGLDRHTNPFPKMLPEEAANPMRVIRSKQEVETVSESLADMFKPLGMEQ